MLDCSCPVLFGGLILSLALTVAGCAQEAPKQEQAKTEPSQQATQPAKTSNGQTPVAQNRPPQPLQPLALGNQPADQPNSQPSGTQATPTAPSKTSSADPMEEIKLALAPLQVLLGDWRGVTNRVINGTKGVVTSHWVWDFKTNRQQPSLVMKSEDGLYLSEARVTWLRDKELFQLTLLDPEGVTRVYEGNFTEVVKDEIDENNKKQRSFKLKLIQVSPEPGAEELVFNQQETNRYLLEISRKRGERMVRYDTIGTQREGTSFALTEDNYGERECIVSQGLGTISLSYQGRTYYVCCTGCQAAFEENPEFWINKAEERKKEKSAE